MAERNDWAVPDMHLFWQPQGIRLMQVYISVLHVEEDERLQEIEFRIDHAMRCSDVSVYSIDKIEDDSSTVYWARGLILLGMEF